jgi:thiamine-phosphate pyrophosphorylase
LTVADPTTAREPPRLYLLVPADKAADDLAAVLEAGDVACVLLLATGLDEGTLRTAIERLRPAARERGVAFLVQDRAALAAATGCDGVHLSDFGGYKAARAILGDDAIVGVGCGNARHDAMVAGEAGADYAAFGAPAPAPSRADPELLTWWQQVMTVPCVAFGAEDPEDCATLAAAGVDFVAVDAAVWINPEGPVAGLRACLAALPKIANGA